MAYQAPKSHPIYTYKRRIIDCTRLYFVLASLKWPIRRPISISFRFVMPRPQDKTWKRKAMPSYPHTGKPDKDNLEKGALDALTEAVLGDDSQVYHGTTEKWVAAGGELPHTVILFDFREPTPDKIFELAQPDC